MLGKLTAVLVIAIGVAMVFLGKPEPRPSEQIFETVLEPAEVQVVEVVRVTPPPRLLPKPPVQQDLPIPVVTAPAPEPEAEDIPTPAIVAEITPVRPVARPDLQDVLPTVAPQEEPTFIDVPTIERVAVAAPRLDPATILYAVGDEVNLRDGPSEYDRIVIQLAAGDSAKLIADPGTGWLLVKTVETGRQGFIAAKLLTPSRPAN